MLDEDLAPAAQAPGPGSSQATEIQSSTNAQSLGRMELSEVQSSSGDPGGEPEQPGNRGSGDLGPHEGTGTAADQGSGSQAAGTDMGSDIDMEGDLPGQEDMDYIPSVLGSLRSKAASARFNLANGEGGCQTRQARGSRSQSRTASATRTGKPWEQTVKAPQGDFTFKKVAESERALQKTPQRVEIFREARIAEARSNVSSAATRASSLRLAASVVNILESGSPAEDDNRDESRSLILCELNPNTPTLRGTNKRTADQADQTDQRAQRTKHTTPRAPSARAAALARNRQKAQTNE
ncbi:hypothetical protein BDV12DRAFT_205154 [Aspergillus spectabilis]